MIKKICENCGEEFAAERNSRRFCSRECVNFSQLKRTEKHCVNCGSSFMPRFANSQKCDRCIPVKNKIEPRPCAHCKETFTPKRYNRNKYCSRSCANRGGRRYDKCINCGESFRANSKAHVYCSVKCRTSNYKNIKPDFVSYRENPIKPTRDGYVRRFIGAGHPMANNNGVCYEHRLVMAEYIGRYLYPEETVHHRDGNRKNNDISNLELWTKNHGAGVRVEDLIEQIVERYTDGVRTALKELDERSETN